MDSGRTLLAGALREAYPSWQIVDTPRAVDSVRKPAAAVLWSERRTRQELQKLTLMAETVVMWVLTASDDPKAIEDDLDELLMAALAVVEATPQLSWTETNRGVLNDKFEGWRIEIQAAYKITT